MDNLTITSKQTNVSAQEIIGGNTVDYNWLTTSEEENPKSVNFFVRRGVVGDAEFNGNITIQGEFYADSNAYNVRNNNFIIGDELLYMSILATCKGVCSGNPETEEKLTNKGK